MRVEMGQPCVTEAAFLFGELAISGSENGNDISVVPFKSQELRNLTAGMERWPGRG
jgi:hypothetical protein